MVKQNHERLCPDFKTFSNILKYQSGEGLKKNRKTFIKLFFIPVVGIYLAYIANGCPKSLTFLYLQ